MWEGKLNEAHAHTEFACDGHMSVKCQTTRDGVRVLLAVKCTTILWKLTIMLIKHESLCIPFSNIICFHKLEIKSLT